MVMVLILLLTSTLSVTFDIQLVKPGSCDVFFGQASVHNLNSGLNYTTIQEAINANETLDGHTIFVDAGIYNETVVVNKTLSITGSGFELTRISGGVKISADNVELSGFTVSGGDYGLQIYSSNNTFYDNYISGNYFEGIYLYSSSGNSFTSNYITQNAYGVSLVQSGENTFRNNSIFNNKWRGLTVEGNDVSSFVQDIDTSNTLDGKPIYYWVNKQDMVVPSDAGYVALVECKRMFVEDLTFFSNGQGVLLAGTSDTIVKNDTLGKEYQGISMVRSSNVTITNCTITDSNFAMEIWFSDGNNIVGNSMTSNAYGIDLAWSNYNNISRSTIKNSTESNGYGIALSVSDTGNQIFENDIVQNPIGVNLELFLGGNNENKIFLNNFMQNAIQVLNSESATEVWDNGYPVGGNCWSDYNGTDVYRGPYQNETGSDAIGDTPYVIDANNTDRYPRLQPYIPLLGDVNQDGVVNLLDAIQAALAFGSKPGDLRWNPAADINHDGIVDIYDLILVASNFGKTQT